MNLAEFKENMKTADNKLDITRMDDIIRKSFSDETPDKFRGFTNLIIVMEEFNEAAQAVSKYLRGKPNAIDNLTEELADSLLSVRYVQLICGISDKELFKAMNVKLDRQHKRNGTNDKN